jgi:hypothetical protein
MAATSDIPSKHHFRLKGEVAEELLHQLASKTFLTDWCFPNPKLPDGKELCDLLVVFESTAIIWQAKNLKLGKGGKLNATDVEKNLRQLSGARRQLCDLKTTVMLENSRRLSEKLDPKAITEVFLISVLLGDTPDFQTLATHVKDHHCHVFNREFTELVLNELDTVADFCAYLREKERVREHAPSLILGGGEKELLAWYLFNERSLAKLEGHNMIFLEEGTWDELQRRPEYRAKKQADAISYDWDELIERVHTTNSLEYERIARVLARPCRFERRCLAEAYVDAHRKADAADHPQGIFRRVLAADNVTVCFLFTGDGVPRETRRSLLGDLCFVARGKCPQHSMVLGIGTEMAIRPVNSLDYCLIEIPEWGAEQDREMRRLQDETGVLTSAARYAVTATEYPESSEGPDQRTG